MKNAVPVSVPSAAPRRGAVVKAAAPMLLALAAFGCAADVLHFVNGDRLTGTLAEAEDGFVAVDVAGVGVVVAPEALVARVETAPQTEAEADAPAADGEDSPAAAADGRWEASVDVGIVVASGNTDTQESNVVVDAKRSGERLDNVLGVATRQAEAQGETTKEQLGLEYDMRWKFRDTWYGVANLAFFRDPIKDIDQRITVGGGLGHTFWDGEAGALTSDLGVSQVFETLDREGGDGESNPALRWSLHFNRWLIDERLEAYHNNRLLRILDASRGAVWDSDTGLRLHLNNRWQAGLRIDVQHETAPTAGREKTDVSYALALGIKL